MYIQQVNSFQQHSDFNGWSIIDKYACNANYLNAIQHVFMQAMNNHPRTLMVRFDLHIPQGHSFDGRMISRFFDSLKARIRAREDKNQRRGVRVHKTKISYVWCREINKSERPHYHVGLFLNADAFNGLGDYREHRDNLAGMIYSAWQSATGYFCDIISSVHFPKDTPCYLLNVRDEYYTANLNMAFQRLSYLAKEETKQYGDRSNNFGTSRVNPKIKEQTFHYS